MFTMVGIDQLNRVKRIGLFSDGNDEPGTIIARPVVKRDDILMDQTISGALGVGSTLINLPTFPVGYLYNVKAFSMYYTGGTITVVKLGVTRGAVFYPFVGVASLADSVLLYWQSDMWFIEGDYLRAQVTVTVAGSVVQIQDNYYRSPYSS